VLVETQEESQYSFQLGLDTAVFQAEIYTIKFCVMENMEIGYTARSICILSGSQAAITALDIFQVKFRLVWDCHNLLMRLAECIGIQLVWVLGHVGNGWKQHSHGKAPHIHLQDPSLPLAYLPKLSRE